MTTLWLLAVPTSLMVLTRVTWPASMFARLMTWMPPEPSVTEYAYSPYTFTSRHRLSLPSIQPTSCVLAGLVTSKNAVPLEVHMIPYSRPLGLT